MKLERRELQAIVMSGGGGNRLPRLANAPPKCLLPVGPYPVIWYSLSLLERQGFLDVIIIVRDNEKVEISSAIDKLALKLKIEYVTIPASDEWGTAESLRHINEKITTDILVLSGDLVTDVDLDGAIELFRKHNAAAVSLMFDNGPPEFIQVPGIKAKSQYERDIVGIDKETQRLVFLASASDYEGTVPLPKALLRKHPSLSIYSILLDSHIYLFRKWVVNFLKEKATLTTIKGELLPYIVKKQLSKPAAAEANDMSVDKMNIHKDIFKFATANKNSYEKKIYETSSYNDHRNGMKPCYNEDIIRCYAYIPKTPCYGIRMNTLSTFCLANSKIISKWDNISKGIPLERIHPSSQVKSKQIDEFSIIGEQCDIAEKTSIKSTTIGSNCIVENKVMLTNCIIMNNVTIKEGCNLQDCIIYPKATVETNCKLTLCIVVPQFTVPAGETAVQRSIPEICENMITLE